LVLDQSPETTFGGRIEFAWSPRRNLGLQGAGSAMKLQKADEARETDGEQVGELAEGMVAPLDGADQSFTQIVRIGSHGSTSSRMCPLKVLYPYAMFA
jgi:hypothetical protein